MDTAADTHADRLNQLGSRIARVAHELNAPVSLIAGSLANLEGQMDALLRYVAATRSHAARDEELGAVYRDAKVDYVLNTARNLLAICDEGVQRVSYVVAQLRTYSRRGAGDVQREIDLAEVLRRAARLAAQGRPAGVQLDWRLAPLPALAGDADGLGQVFVNLFGNAFDALAGRPDPRVEIGAEADAERILVRLRDNGPGIPIADRGAIFDPFVSSKPSGVGLGLAIAREAVERHGGSITVGGAPGVGAEFVVVLPLSGPVGPLSAGGDA